MIVLRDTDRRPVPWRVGDLLLLSLTSIAGLLLVVVAWFQASGAVAIQHQVAWVDVGVVGVIVAGAGNVLWLLTGRRSVGELRRRLTPYLAAKPAAARPVVARTLVAGSTMTRYHRADCALVAGKRVRSATAHRHERDGRRPCDVCLAEQT